jgi:hypothetical protein
MRDLLLVTVANSFDNLFEEETCQILWQSFTSSNVGVQVSANAHLHHKANMVVSLERVVQLDDVFVLELAEDLHLLF